MKSIIRYFLITSLILISLSCGNETTHNPIMNQASAETSVNTSLVGTWLQTDPSGNPDKNITYIFESNNTCQIYKGNEKQDVNPGSYYYQVISKFNSNLVLIKDSKNNTTIFTINSIDNSIMRVIFMVIGNKKINDNVEVELYRVNA
jgi:hypothetical protein